jgi:glucosamine 6-phosphate synthetase-like amidotransferase/phosphosugar isomerase protein
MCGILGFIGQSKDQEKTRVLITELFETMQVRGTDASGFYCSTADGKYHYTKQPGISSELVKTENYQNIWNDKLDLGIFHCRAASVGVGLPSENENNHPFVSDDYKKAIIHNGLVSSKEYINLKNYFKTKTECDSEIILRVLEKENDIIKNIKFLFDNTKNSYFAIAYAECKDNSKNLILTRNKHRPLFFVDLRKELGQIVFFSTFEIFLSTLIILKNKGYYFESNNNFYNIKPYEIISFELDNNNNISFKNFIAEEKQIEETKQVIKSLQEQNVLDYISTAIEKIKEIETGIKLCIGNKTFSDSELDDIIHYVDQIIINLNSINTEFFTK